MASPLCFGEIAHRKRSVLRRIDRPDDPAGTAGRQNARRDIAHHNAAACNDRARADGHARHDLHAAAQPHVVADRNRLRIFQQRIARFHIQRMRGRIQAALRRNEDIVPDGDRCAVENDQTVVCVEILPQLDVIAVIAPEVRLNGKFRAGPEQSSQQRAARLPRRRR